MGTTTHRRPGDALSYNVREGVLQAADPQGPNVMTNAALFLGEGPVRPARAGLHGDAYRSTVLVAPPLAATLISSVLFNILRAAS